MAMALSQKAPILSTAGAIPVRNEKGDLTMEKVKVQRYVTGKRPDYAPEYSSESEDDELVFGQKKMTPAPIGLPEVKTDAGKEDRRLRRLHERHQDESDEDVDDEADRVTRHRRLVEPEVLDRSDEEEEVEKEEEKHAEESSEEEEEELDEEEIERRRGLLRQRAKQQREEEEVLEKEEENSEEGSEEESSEYEEYTDSEEEETGPRLKPVFVRKKDRITIQEKEREEMKLREQEMQAKQMAEDRRLTTLQLVAEEARREAEETRGVKDACDLVDTDEDNDEEEYEAWKVRELKRIKRDREERETAERERMEIERLHGLTEEERKAELRDNPRQVINKATKGKYKFLQKYYHRGAFFMDKEDQVYTRDFANPTLEDHFDKTILPKVMQVKNFGRSGRTKYTHLVDQDTTQFDSPWVDSSSGSKSSNRFPSKQSFERPSTAK